VKTWVGEILSKHNKGYSIGSTTSSRNWKPVQKVVYTPSVNVIGLMDQQDSRPHPPISKKSPSVLSLAFHARIGFNPRDVNTKLSRYFFFLAVLALVTVTSALATAQSSIPAGPDLVGNIKAARAYWVNRDTLAWFGAEPNDAYQLYYSPDAGITDVATSGPEGDGKPIPLTVDPNGLSETIIEKFPFLNGATAFKIAHSQLGQVPSLLKDQLVLVKFNGAQAADATSLQLPGVLDDLFYFDGRLGAHFADGAVQFRLWAVQPTSCSMSYISATSRYRIPMFRRKIAENTPHLRIFSPLECSTSGTWRKPA
jgi:hypothetical protein